MQPKPTVIAERYKFHQRIQDQIETVSKYLAGLKRAATDCQYEAFLEESLWDQFVCGLASEAIRRRLLLEKELTLTKMAEIAVAKEVAEKDSKNIQETKSNENVNALKNFKKQNKTTDKKAVRQTTEPCYRCGRKGHQPQNCQFREAQCHNCGKTGHIAVACRNRTRQQNTKADTQRHLESESEEEELSHWSWQEQLR